MNLRLALGTSIVALLTTSVAAAQDVTIGYQGLPYKASEENNTGVQVSDGVLLHIGAGAEFGYDSNVFYQNADPRGSGLLRVMPYAQLTNATRTGPASRQLSFDARVGLLYRQYLSEDQDVKRYDAAWMPNAGLALGIGGGQLSFGLADTFARIEDPPYGPAQGGMAVGPPITRNNNQASVEGRWAPGGGRLAGTLRYTNMVDIFENTYAYASTVTNLLMVDAAWKWLPKTAIFVNAQQGFVFYTDTEAAEANGKVKSYPLRVTAGLRGLLTEKTAAVLALGYNNGFYSTGPSTGGFLGSSFLEATLTVKPTMLSRVVLGYRHDFVNAVISTYSYNDTVYASYVQQIASRLALDLSGRWVRRNYGGVFVDPSQQGRVDNQFQVGASLDYFLRNWTYIGAAYSLLTNNASGSDSPTGMNLDYLNYVKQQMFVRLGVTY